MQRYWLRQRHDDGHHRGCERRHGFGSGVVTNGATRVTITGGTGRFAGASGYYDVAGTTVFTGPLTFTLSFTQSGTVSY